MEDDLEVDCCPINDNDEKRITSVHLDSGIASLPSGFNLKSDATEGRFASNEESLNPLRSDLIERGVQNLTLQNKVSDCKHDSVDEGYSSKSFRSGDLDSVKEEAKEADTGETENSETEKCRRLQLVDDVFSTDDEGDTKLHSSIIHLLEPMSLFFISLVTDSGFLNLLNLANNYLQTPLHLAVITKQHLLVRKLMTAGASVDVRDHKGNSPLHIAAKEGDAVSARLLVEPIKYEETKELKYALPYQQIPQNLEARNYDGQMCIHLAAEGCHVETLSVLLSRGANINARDGKSGRTILHYAAESGNLVLLDFLLAQESLDVDCITYSALTPAMLAAGRNNGEVVKRLRAKGAYFDSDESGEEDMEDESYDDIKINGVLIRK